MLIGEDYRSQACRLMELKSGLDTVIERKERTITERDNQVNELTRTIADLKRSLESSL